MDLKQFNPSQPSKLGQRTDSWNFFSDEKRPCAASLYSWRLGMSMAIRACGLGDMWHMCIHYICMIHMYVYIYISTYYYTIQYTT